MHVNRTNDFSNNIYLVKSLCANVILSRVPDLHKVRRLNYSVDEELHDRVPTWHT